MSKQLFEHRPIVVTNCTARKRSSEAPVTLRSASKAELPRQMAQRWATAISMAPRTSLAADLYVGRAIAEAKAVSQAIGADLYIISAGLGLVHASSAVPNYDLSASTATGNLQSALARTNSATATWWNAITPLFGTVNPLANLVSKSSDREVLVALPSTYLSLVRDDLAHVDINCATRLRIFTSAAGAAMVPSHLQQCVLPYDERLETLSGFDGTRTEFAQRALRHFVDVLNGHRLPLAEARAVVRTAISELKLRQLPLRQKKTDEQIVSLLHKSWEARAGSSSRLLRYLRDDALVACEQSRFRQLWLKVQAERTNNGQEVYAA